MPIIVWIISIIVVSALACFGGYFYGKSLMQRSYSAQLEELKTSLARAETTAKLLDDERQRNEIKVRDNANVLQALIPLQSSLQAVTERVEALKLRQERQDTSLQHQLSEVRRINADVLTAANRLDGALRTSSTRGTWGEVEIRRIFEISGLHRHIDFDEQVVQIGGSGASLRPDAVVHLPNEKCIVVDSKVPMESYITALEVPLDDQNAAHRKQLMAAHAKAVTSHIDGLAKKNYGQVVPGSAEFVVMFVPSEPVLSSALDADPTLLDRALRKGVCLATPATLLALLRTVQATWALADVQDESAKILKIGEELVSRLAPMVKYSRNLGKSLGKAISDYNQMVSSLENRILVTARRLQAAQGRDSLIISEGEDAGLEHTVRNFSAPELAEIE